MPHDNEHNRGGSTRWLEDADYRSGGFYRQSDDAIYIGIHKRRKLFHNSAACVLICAGSRSGKGNGIIVPNLINDYTNRTKVIFDWKKDLAMITRDQSHTGRKCVYIAPIKAFDLPQHRVNPLGLITPGSPNRDGDIKSVCINFLPESNGSNAKYFELTGQRFLEAIMHVVLDRDGELTFPAIYQIVNLIQQDGADEWEDFAILMRAHPNLFVQAVEAEIRAGKDAGNNGFYGVISEVQTAFGCFSDFNLMRSVSPPFDVTWQEVILEGGYNVYLNYEAKFAKQWSRVARTNLEAIKTIKERSPQAPGVDIWVDEAAMLAPLPEAAEMSNYLPGLGVRMIWVFQTFKQMDTLLKEGSLILPAACGTQLFFGQRELANAKRVSEMIGKQTLYFDDSLKQADSARLARNAVDDMLSGGDPFEAGIEQAHHARAAKHRSQTTRYMQMPDEVMRLKKGLSYLFADGCDGVGLPEIPPYYECRDQAGKYLPDPYHPPMDKVQVMTWLGRRWRPVCRGAPPEEMRQFPQYQGHDHLWVGK